MATELAPDGLLVADTDGVIQLANAQCERLFGYTPEELIGNSVEMLVPSDVRSRHHALREGFHGSPDARAMGVGRDDGRWPRFLARRYGSLRDVCQAYEISATGFAQVLPIRREDARTPADYSDA